MLIYWFIPMILFLGIVTDIGLENRNIYIIHITIM